MSARSCLRLLMISAKVSFCCAHSSRRRTTSLTPSTLQQKKRGHCVDVFASVDVDTKFDNHLSGVKAETWSNKGEVPPLRTLPAKSRTSERLSTQQTSHICRKSQRDDFSCSRLGASCLVIAAFRQRIRNYSRAVCHFADIDNSTCLET